MQRAPTEVCTWGHNMRASGQCKPRRCNLLHTWTQEDTHDFTDGSSVKPEIHTRQWAHTYTRVYHLQAPSPSALPHGGCLAETFNSYRAPHPHDTPSLSPGKPRSLTKGGSLGAPAFMQMPNHSSLCLFSPP